MYRVHHAKFGEAEASHTTRSEKFDDCFFVFFCSSMMKRDTLYNCDSYVVVFASASAEPHEIRVHLVRLMCQPCEDPVQPAGLVDLRNNHRQRRCCA